MKLACTGNSARHDIMATALPSALLRLPECANAEIAAAAAGALGNLLDGSKDVGADVRDLVSCARRWWPFRIAVLENTIE